jgi:hypothetical protein
MYLLIPIMSNKQTRKKKKKKRHSRVPGLPKEDRILYMLVDYDLRICVAVY